MASWTNIQMDIWTNIQMDIWTNIQMDTVGQKKRKFKTFFRFFFFCSYLSLSKPDAAALFFVKVFFVVDFDFDFDVVVFHFETDGRGQQRYRFGLLVVVLKNCFKNKKNILFCLSCLIPLFLWQCTYIPSRILHNIVEWLKICSNYFQSKNCWNDK